ncbi:hypothetical protein BZA77DRAFT_296006 [Pyronema omphalodes]|nr:hypothetical protein BZA77DRAFT_296006 [Pyronema omphalodes]
MMERICPISQSPRRLSERRGKPELQPLDPVMSSMGASSGVGTEKDIESADSSIPSGVFSPDNFATPAMSAPTTPTDFTLPRALPSFSSIQEEEETSCDCEDCEARCGEYGLGLAVGGPGTMGTKDVAFPRLDTISTTNVTAAGERTYMFSSHTSPTSPVIDDEAFTSGSLSLPQSPKSEVVHSSRSRATTILNKVVPAKLRASLRRRMSGANDNANQLPPLPPLDTMPSSSLAAIAALHTPPEDEFGSCYVSPTSMSAPISYSRPPSPDAILPPAMYFGSPRSPIEQESYLSTSPLQSPRGVSIMEVLPETSYFPNQQPEHIESPLHPPTITPLTSPSLSPRSQTSLNYPSSIHTHRKVPSIDPASSTAPKQPAPVLTEVTVDSLADMIEEMNADLAVYDATLARMRSTGWSSPQEIQNVETQREESKQSWDSRIEESKRVLQQRKMSEMANMSGFEELGYCPTNSTTRRSGEFMQQQHI